MSSSSESAKTLAVTGARLVTPGGVIEQGTLVIRDRKIAEVSGGGNAPAGAETVNASGLTLLPGFIDVHIHGGGGADTMDANPDALRAVLRAHARHGTTGLLLTTMTQSRERIDAALAAARDAHRAGGEFCPDGAQVLGIHLEGPYISPKKPGAQPKEFVRDYDPEEFDNWLETAGGAMKLITLASEQPGADALIAACREAGIVVSLGHTNANARETEAALSRGAAHATHLFNQMPPIHHRDPGPIPVFLTDERARVEVIADGHHIAPEVVRLIVRARGTQRVMLITDAMAGTDMPEGLYDLGGLPVTVAGGRATLADGTLAGSVLTMDRAAANVREWANLDWPDIARLSSTNAADQMGWKNKGRIAPGADADFVLVDDNLAVQAVYIAGNRIHRV